MYSRCFHKNRLIIFGAFIFAFVAAFAFLATKNQDETEAASTSNFRAGNIISDAVMTDYNSMTVAQIHSFLKSKNACNQPADIGSVNAIRYEDVNEVKHGIRYNRRYYFNTSSGVTSGLYHVENNHFVCMADETISGQSAAYIIWDAAQSFKINPKVLIVLLEKEQSLITDKWPYEVQYRAATGYGCPDSAACDSQYYGLEAQVGNAAYLFAKIVYENKWNNYPVGNNYIKYNYNAACGGSTVRVENRATGALYTYTPYQPNAASLAAGYGLTGDGCGAYGNRNFYLLFTDWFGDLQNATGRTKEPDATYISIVEKSLPGVQYQSHIQDYGWEGGWLPVANGTISGTVGESKRLEAMNVRLANLNSAHIYYMSHVEDYGWEQNWTSDGKITGTTGKAKRLEAMKIKLDDTTAKSYDVYYRSHIQDYGWLSWAKNGEASGSEGLAKRLEAIQIFLVKKGGTPPENVVTNNSRSFIKK